MVGSYVILQSVFSDRLSCLNIGVSSNFAGEESDTVLCLNPSLCKEDLMRVVCW
jgi:hypothetical protein